MVMGSSAMGELACLSCGETAIVSVFAGFSQCSGPARHQQYRRGGRQQPRTAAVENPLAPRLREPAAHMQTHIGVGADGEPFQRQEHRSQQGKLRRDRTCRVDELRQEGGKNQDCLGIAWA